MASDRRSLLHLSAAALRDAGYIAEADQLAERVRVARAWQQATPEHVLALSYFGSVRYDELLAAITVERAA